MECEVIVRPLYYIFIVGGADHTLSQLRELVAS